MLPGVVDVALVCVPPKIRGEVIQTIAIVMAALEAGRTGADERFQDKVMDEEGMILAVNPEKDTKSSGLTLVRLDDVPREGHATLIVPTTQDLTAIANRVA
jgi:hypothetical protein